MQGNHAGGRAGTGNHRLGDLVDLVIGNGTDAGQRHGDGNDAHGDRFGIRGSKRQRGDLARGCRQDIHGSV